MALSLTNTPALALAEAHWGLLSGESAPALDGFNYVGRGWCVNIKGTSFPFTFITAPSVGECAKACKDRYSSDDAFVGINFLTGDSPVCNCMMNWSGNGLIAGAKGARDRVCYSYNDAAIKVEGYKYKGRGWCQHDEGKYYAYDIVKADNVNECAEACTEKYSSKETFVGINFNPNSHPLGRNCKCMLDRKGIGKITGTRGNNEEICYSYNDAVTMIGGYHYVGKGCCVNSKGYYYDGDFTPALTLDECANSCRGDHHSSQTFVGINFDPLTNNCNCMMDLHDNGAINGTEIGPGNTCTDQLCYRYSESISGGPAPIIGGYTFHGEGCCLNSEGSYYDNDPRLYVDANTVDECADACTKKYSTDVRYVGIDYSPEKWDPCECIIDWHKNGKISGAGMGAEDSCPEKFCYSFNGSTSKKMSQVMKSSLALSFSLGIILFAMA